MWKVPLHLLFPPSENSIRPDYHIAWSFFPSLNSWPKWQLLQGLSLVILVEINSPTWHSFFFHPHLCLLILERGERRERGRETLMWERNIDQLHLIYSWDQTHNPGMWPGIEPATFWSRGWCSNQLGHTGQGPTWLAFLLYFPSYIFLHSTYYY